MTIVASAFALMPVVAAGSPRLHSYLNAAAQQLDPNARRALSKIEGLPRQLLAMRAYLRAADRLVSRWSWTDAEIASYTASQEYRDLLAEIQRVTAIFEAGNPGYSLYVNTRVRSLDQQLERWNTNRSVGNVAARLQLAAMQELQKPRYPSTADIAAAKQFAEYLQQWQPPVAVPLAAPGLSPHGQMRAVDFQVSKGGAIVAGPEVATVDEVWERAGWKRKLQAALNGSKFVGPLQIPNEPWHYEYVPAASRAVSKAP